MNNTSAVSAVIPSRAEAAWLRISLPLLTDMPEIAEVIVADHKSNDDTATLCASYGVKIIEGGTPSTARNRGREVARSSVILFLDADTYVSRDSLKRALRKLECDEQLACVCFQIKPLGRNAFDHFAYHMASTFAKLAVIAGLGQGTGNALLVRAKAFDAAGGFAEDLSFGEDAEFIRRLRRLGHPVTMSRLCVAWTSSRRLRREGRIAFAAKVVVWTLFEIFGRPGKPFAYDWTPFPPEWAIDDASDLRTRMTP